MILDISQAPTWERKSIFTNFDYTSDDYIRSLL